jgi:hypothetical protein
MSATTNAMPAVRRAAAGSLKNGVGDGDQGGAEARPDA